MVVDRLESIPASVILESIPSLLLLFAPDGGLALANASARDALGLVGGAPPGGALHSALAPAVAAVAAAGAPVRIERTRVEVRGETRVFGFSCTPVTLDGRVAGVLVTGRDLTDHVNLDRELRGLERAAEVENVARKVSHELRNPLNAVRGYAQFLALGLPEDAPQRAAADVIVREADRMDRILSGLRDLGSAGRLELTLCDPGACVREALLTVSPLLRSKGIEPSLHFAAPLPAVLHDPGRLHQVFLNLLKNAAEAVDYGGAVAVAAGPLGAGGFWAEVSDDGPGVAPELADRVFDLFVSTKGADGEGVGLAVSQEILHLHGGTLRLAGSGPGAVFRVEIPGR